MPQTMRIRIVRAADICKDGIADKTCQALTEELERGGSVTITEENPDVIHIIGAWNDSAMSIANDANGKFIAWIHTPLASLSPWHKPSEKEIKLSANATMVIASGTMEKELLQEACKDNLKTIANSVITSTNSAQNMASSYIAVYQEAYKTTELSLLNHILDIMKPLALADENISFILQKFIHAQYLHEKGCLPKLFLDNMAQQMTMRNYDEDSMAALLKQVGIYEFAQRLEYVMQEESSLTEGFMPIPLLCDKQAEKMIKLITNY